MVVGIGTGNEKGLNCERIVSTVEYLRENKRSDECRLKSKRVYTLEELKTIKALELTIDENTRAPEQLKGCG